MKLSEESRKKISEKRKKWLADNPDKHPWRNNNKFKSEPCERVKEFLKRLNINFIEEFDPKVKNRNFSIDIALPDKKIAIEINGNQHYEKTGKLKPYYQERNDLLENDGWIVYQIHYSACFNFDKWVNFVSELKNSAVKIEFDYFNYVPKEKNNYHCVVCGKYTRSVKKMCRKCYGSSSRNPTGNISLEERCDMQFHQGAKKFCFLCKRRHYSKSNYCRFCSKDPSKTNTCKCGSFKHKNSKMCYTCAKLKSRKIINRPSKEELEKLIWEFPLTKLGNMFSVSDNAIRKWCKFYGITNIPNSSYRTKKYFENL